MSLSPLLNNLKAQEQDYEASAATKEKLSDKVLVALVAPTAVGKSTLINRALAQAGDGFSEAYSVTTRARRTSDPAGYKTADEGYDIEKVTQMINARELTHYFVHPSGQIYGSLPESFPAAFNFLPCVPTILPVVKRAGFSTVHTAYLVASVSDWAARLPARRSDPSYVPRLHEAIESLTWALAHSHELTFVENATGKIDQAAQSLIDISRGRPIDISKEKGAALAQAMLVFITQELSHQNTP